MLVFVKNANVFQKTKKIPYCLVKITIKKQQKKQQKKNKKKTHTKKLKRYLKNVNTIP
jgi:hypothetical protein